MLPQHEQVWVENASFTSIKTTPACWLLYSNIVFKLAQPASSVLLAILVLTSFALSFPAQIRRLRLQAAAQLTDLDEACRAFGQTIEHFNSLFKVVFSQRISPLLSCKNHLTHLYHKSTLAYHLYIRLK